MKSYQKLSLLFFIKRSKKDNNNRAPIYVRVTIDGHEDEFSTGLKSHVDYWDSTTKQDLERSSRAASTNKQIHEMLSDLERHFNVLAVGEERVSPQMLKNVFQGRPAHWSKNDAKLEAEKKHNLLEAVDVYIAMLSEKVAARKLSKSTRDTWVLSKKYLEEYVTKGRGLSDIELKAVNKDFFSEFVHYLTVRRTVRIAETTAEKRIIHLKAFLEFAVDKDWVKPLKGEKFSFNPKATRVTPLEYEEVLKIWEKKMHNSRLEKVRDIFVFQCFTAFSYADLAALTPNDVKVTLDVGRFIVRSRLKTDVNATVPLLPVVAEIIAKYENDADCLEKGMLLPVSSNQKYNAYLKEVADICNIESDLRTHLARHTFAHIMLNEFNLPVEDVAAMMGHNSTKSTRAYCQVGRKRLKRNMDSVREQMCALASTKSMVIGEKFRA